MSASRGTHIVFGLSALASCGRSPHIAVDEPSAAATHDQASDPPSPRVESGAPIADRAGRSDDRTTQLASVPKADGGDPVRCLSDAGAGRDHTIVRFVTVSRKLGPDCTAAKVLDLDVPSVGLARELCNSGCGPYRFLSHRESPTRTSFSCSADLDNVVGSIDIDRDVLHIEVLHDPEQAMGPFADLNDAASGPIRPPQRESIPLRCGSRVEIQTSAPAQWIPSGTISR